ncbi:MAG: branched-chain amino acid ABC transporter ATP-binding protein/permease, partial [Streptosporangiaceae bacterium]|nr:branched-chain amino acid ABC transporter ATP-binding protein/permease [Streptosporangiaceae bacterium]
MFYIINLLIYAGVDIMACLGLSQQFGVAGVTNFGFIIFQAAGAYTAAVLSLPPSSANGGFQSYIGGWNLPFPVPWIGGAIAGGLIALPFTFLVGRRLRGDFAAVGLLVTAVMVNLLVTNYRPSLNGSAGLSLVPAPLQGEFNPQSQGYQWAYSAVSLVLAAGAYLLVRRVTESPYGRSMRAMRDNDAVADSLGKNLVSLRASVLVLGGMLAGLSGAVLVGFINLWAPSAWGYAETIVLFAAVIIGGAGNHRGAVLGAILVPVAFEEATRFIPQFGAPGLIDDLQWVAIGLLIVVFLWLRPQGILPERRRRIEAAAASAATASAATVSATVIPTDTVILGDTSIHKIPVGRTTTTTTTADAAPGVLVPGEAVLRAAGLTKDFGGVHAVADATLEVRRGTLTGLIGPNGAGKSTLLGILAGTVPPSSGQVIYDGHDVTGIPAYRRARLGLARTFQLASEFRRLTVMENLLSAVPGHRGDSLRGALAGPRYWRRDEDAAIARARVLLDQFGLAQHADTYAGDLSGGQRRLVEIMRALMMEPKVLLLDEPMAGVHPVLARRIGDQLTALCAAGMTILMVEHELAIMDEFC